MRPALLLDIDGVLCPFGADCPQGYTELPIRGELWVWVSEENTRRLAKLATLFELVWCTAWEHDANETIGPHHEIDSLKVIEFGTIREGDRIYVPPPQFGHSWKWPWVSAFINAREGPVAWIDDDICSRDRDPYEDRDDVLLIKTDCAVGITDAHVDELTEFAHAHS